MWSTSAVSFDTCIMSYFRERAAAAAVARPKVKKNAALLSFEDDAGGDEDDEGDDNGGGDGKPAAAARIRSAHEAIDDARYTCLTQCQGTALWLLSRNPCAHCSLQLHSADVTSCQGQHLEFVSFRQS